jgi:CHAT domain-containing protein/tetratricopeptide (TPR) repeat protein
MSPVNKCRLRAKALLSLCLALWFVCSIASPVLPQTAHQPVMNEEELAAALVAAKTEEERRALLAAEKRLVTIKLQRALVKQGQSLYTQGDYAQALTIYQLALQLAEQLGDKAGMADALRGIGAINFSQGEYAQALDYHQRSLKLAEDLGNKELMARVLRNIGNVRYAQGDYKQSLDYYQRSLKLTEELGDEAGSANTMGNIGSIHIAQGDYKQALDYFQRSLRLAERLGDKMVITRVLNNLGIVHTEQGNYMQALDYYQRSLKLTEELGYRVGTDTALNNIGRLYKLQGSYAQALDYTQRSLKLAEALGDKLGIARALNSFGVIYAEQGDYTLALDYYQKSFRLMEELGDKNGILLALNNIGYTYRWKGSYAQALDYHQRSLKLAEEVGDKNSITNSLSEIGIAHLMQGSYAQALDFARRAATLADQIGIPESFVEASITAGKAYRALNQPAQARQAFADAISAIERWRAQVAGGEQERQRFFEDKLVPYYQMVDLLVMQGNMAEALAYAEHAKGRVLLDVLRSGRANITKAMTVEEQAQERRLNSELVSLNSQIYRENFRPQPDPARLSELHARLQKARLESESFRTSLYAAHPELKERRGETPPLTLNEAARLLPADGNTALLEYSIADDKSFLFVLTKAQPRKQQDNTAVVLKVYPLDIKSKELSGLVETFQKRLGQRNLAFSPLAQHLYQLLLKPAEEQLRGTDTLCVVPDGVLWQLPFQALKPTPRRYLIEDHAIFYAPSLTTLSEMLKPGKLHSGAQRQASSTLLAFGNPLLNPQTVVRQQAIYRGEALGPLPEAEREVNALRQLYGGVRSRVYTGAAAREEHAKAEIGNYRVVHFATHGVLDNRSPLYSHLLLAQEPNGSGEDGLLEAHEIMEMNLQAELVVLSACQTAGGRVGAGEGVIGMTWALFVAGCPTTLVSQWKVDTRSTSKLMVEFHANLQGTRRRAGAVTKAEALRQAMLTLLRSEEYELPYYWAPFVLVGNGF